MANTEKLNLDIIATDKASGPIKKVRDEIDKVSNTAKTTAKSATNLDGAIGGIGRRAGQAGIQIQQFTGQVSAGTNPLLAFSQQATDLGFVLGFPLLGAITGIAASIGMAFVPSLFQASESAAELQKRIKGMGLSFSDITPAMRDFLSLQLEHKIRAEEAAIKENNERIKEINQSYDQYGYISKKTGDELEQLLATIDLSNASIRVHREEIERVNGVNYGWSESLKDIKQGLTDELMLTGANAAEKLAYKAAMEGATVAQISELLAIQEAIDAKKQQIETEREWDRVHKASEEASDRFLESLKDQTATLGMTRGETIRYRASKLALSEAEREAVDQMAAQIDKHAELQKAVKESNKVTKEYGLTLQDIGENGIKTLEDSLVDFAMGTKSAKDAFRDMAASIVRDIVRMQIQQSVSKPLFGMLQGFIGGGSPIVASQTQAGFVAAGGAFADGGMMPKNKVSLVGERGPELVIPNSNSTVVSNESLQGLGGSPIQVTLNISTGVSQTVRAEIANLLPQITAATKAAVADARQRGGGYSKSLVGA